MPKTSRLAARKRDKAFEFTDPRVTALYAVPPVVFGALGAAWAIYDPPAILAVLFIILLFVLPATLINLEQKLRRLKSVGAIFLKWLVFSWVCAFIMPAIVSAILGR